jgi:hypothetical protein
LTVSAAATAPPVTGYGVMGMGILPGLGLFGTVLAARKRNPLTRKSVGWTTALGLVLLVSIFSVGCGSSSNNKPTTPVSQAVNLTVKGTSGSIAQTSVVAVTIN